MNPWAEDGSLVPLADYPRMADYLSRHPVLASDTFAKKSPNNWHRTIDKVHADLVDKPKLLIRT